MSESIECAIIKLPKLKNKSEVERYITTELENHFPEPEKLIFDYITKAGGSTLVAFTQKEDFTPGLHHPFLIIDKIRGNGEFRFFYDNCVLDLKIEKGAFIYVKNYHSSEPIPQRSNLTVFSDRLNMPYLGKGAVELEKAYRKRRKNLFERNKGNYRGVIIFIILLTSTLLILSKEREKKEEILKELEYLKLSYSKIESDNRVITNKSLLEKESLLTPPLYSLFYDIGTLCDSEIESINLNGREISLAISTDNTIKAVESLNRSNILSLKAGSIKMGESRESGIIYGEILCP